MSEAHGRSRNGLGALFGRLKERLFPDAPEPDGVREVIEELIEERAEDSPGEAPASIDPNERLLLSNVLKLRDTTAADIMVPRADIDAIDADTPVLEVFRFATREGHSRYPVYRGTLDDVIGMIHIKDVALALSEPEKTTAYEGIEDGAPAIKLADLVRKVLFVSPAVRVLDLLLQMRLKRTHMALVVDEYGGIDGLVTIEDVVEQIVGNIEDEHDAEQPPEITETADGGALADARLALSDFEARYGALFSEEERAEADTLAGLVARLAGRVPSRGELIKHPSGLEFEVLDGDARRVRRLRVTHIPRPPAPGAGTGK